MGNELHTKKLKLVALSSGVCCNCSDKKTTSNFLCSFEVALAGIDVESWCSFDLKITRAFHGFWSALNHDYPWIRADWIR